MNLKKALRYGLGYARRPYLWADLPRQLVRLWRLRDPKEDTAPLATAWASEYAVETAEAIEQITGRPPCGDLALKYPEIVRGAEERVRNCPVRLGGAGNMELLYNVVAFVDARTVVETGVAYGWSSLAILLAMEGNPDARLYSIDRPDMKLPVDDHVGCVVPGEYRSRWELLRGVDRDRLPELLRRLGDRESLDLVHYDSDKSYFGRTWAYGLLWEGLKGGGFLISDDISDNVAFKEFCDSSNVDPIVIRKGSSFVGVVQKPRGRA